MEQRKIYIKSATQISVQEPLVEAWMTNPLFPDAPYTRCIDPNFRDWLPPLESRRMGKIMRRAVVTAMKVLQSAGITRPDAIITGTGLGCIENTELFLDQLCKEGEEMLKPTYFMQSTHNTISSLIAIKTQCHGYNSTYSHKSISFDSALLDAFVQMKLGDANSVLVTGNDEMTPSYYEILQRTGYVGQTGQVTAGETSVAMVLAAEDNGDTLCEIEEMKVSFGRADFEGLLDGVDAVMMGYNGNKANDEVYERIRESLPDLPVLQYKNLFGECYTVSSLGVYAAAHLLKAGTFPSFMRYGNCDIPEQLRRLLFINHSDGQSFCTILLKKTN